MKALLVFCDVEGPVAIEVPAQVDGSELDDSLGHLFSPAHSRTLHPIFDEVLARALDRTTGDRPALGEIFVITHVSAIAVQVVGNATQRLALGPQQPAFGDALTNPLDDLTDFAEQDSQGVIQNPEFGFQAPL